MKRLFEKYFLIIFLTVVWGIIIFCLLIFTGCKKEEQPKTTPLWYIGTWVCVGDELEYLDSEIIFTADSVTIPDTHFFRSGTYCYQWEGDSLEIKLINNDFGFMVTDWMPVALMTDTLTLYSVISTFQYMIDDDTTYIGHRSEVKEQYSRYNKQ